MNTPGTAIGDINFDSPSGNSYLLPISYGKYFELDFPIKMSKIEEFTATYKEEMRSKWAAETGVANLSPAELASIEKINSTNVAGFLFQKSMKTDFGSANEHDWLFFKIIPSIPDPTYAALFLDGDGKQWNKTTWKEKYINMPPFTPESQAINEMRDKLKFVSSKGHMFEDDEENQHFILDDVYKSLFSQHFWRLKKENDHVYMASYKIGGLEKHIFRDKVNNHLFQV